MGGVTRRYLLRGAGSVLAAGQVVGRPARSRESSSTSQFTPVDHGFGFRNWSPQSQYFDPPSAVDPTTVRDHVRTAWHDRSQDIIGIDTTRLPAPLIDAIATQLRTSIAQYAGTNGHCYGMVLAAQQYFDLPEAIPVDRRTASEIEDPTVPVDQPEAPVYDDIVRLQANQFLRFRSWLGRRAILHPDWIDLEAVVSDVRRVIDTFDTAALLVFDDRLYGHQVLAYEYHDTGSQIELRVYDPNRTAESYRSGTESVRFDRDGNGLTMRPYHRYSGVLFNRFDRIERLPGRADASPLDHLTVDGETVRSSLFPLALVTVDVDAVSLVARDPDGRPLERLRGVHMDRSRGESARMRVRYGAAEGTYQVNVFGGRTTDYTIRAIVTGLDGELLDTTDTDTIAAGQHHRYELEIPEAGAGTLTRITRSSHRSGLDTGLMAVGGLAAGAVGYRFLSRRDRDTPGDNPRNGR